MAELVEELLLLARLDEGRPLERRRVDLAEVVVEAIDAARARGPGLARSRCSVDDVVVVDGDASRLRQVIDNLLANVRTHTPPGTTTSITIGRGRRRGGRRRRRRRSGDDRRRRSRVRALLPRRPVAVRQSGGAGLGMAIVAAHRRRPRRATSASTRRPARGLRSRSHPAVGATATGSSRTTMNEWWWYLTRATGIVATVLAVASLVFGLVLLGAQHRRATTTGLVARPAQLARRAGPRLRRGAHRRRLPRPRPRHRGRPGARPRHAPTPRVGGHVGRHRDVHASRSPCSRRGRGEGSRDGVARLHLTSVGGVAWPGSTASSRVPTPRRSAFEVGLAVAAAVGVYAVCGVRAARPRDRADRR